MRIINKKMTKYYRETFNRVIFPFILVFYLELILSDNDNLQIYVKVNVKVTFQKKLRLTTDNTLLNSSVDRTGSIAHLRSNRPSCFSIYIFNECYSKCQSVTADRKRLVAKAISYSG